MVAKKEVERLKALAEKELTPEEIQLSKDMDLKMEKTGMFELMNDME